MAKKIRKPAPVSPVARPVPVTPANPPKIAVVPNPAASWFSAWWVYAAIAALCFAFYANTLGNGYVMDDGAVITDNVTVKKGFAAIPELFKQSSVYGATKENYGTYRPLTMSSFAAEVGMFGENPKAQHFIHILAYALLCVVLYKVLRRLLVRYNPWIPLVAVVLFAVHPLHTEVGASIKSRDEIYSLGLAMATLYFLLKQLDEGKGKLAAYALFFLALLSKESAITFLAVLPLSLYFFREVSWGRIAALCWPLLIPAAVYLLMRNAVLEPMPEGVAIINNSLAEADSLIGRLPTILYIMLRYLGLLFYPHPLSWDYGYNQIPLKTWTDPMVLLSLALHLAFAAVAIGLFVRKNLFSWCILFYYITLSTSANVVVLIAATMGERFVFTPSVGFCVALAAGLVALCGGLLQADGLRVRKWALLAVVAVISAASFMKVQARNRDWESNYTLFKAGTEASPNSYRANSAFAYQALRDGEKSTDPQEKTRLYQEALQHYQKAVSIYSQMSADWFNLGVVHSHLGNAEESHQALVKSFELNPNFFNVAYNLGNNFMHRKDYPNMLKHYKRASEIDPNFGDVLFKVGLSYHYLNDLPNAIAYYERHLQKDPRSREALTNLQIAYNGLGNTQKAAFYAAQLNAL